MNRHDTHTAPDTSRNALPIVAVAIAFAAIIAASFAAGIWAVLPLETAQMPKWVLARASGITSYLLLTAVTALGILLSHPHRARWTWPTIATRLRFHIILATFAITFTALHLSVLAIDDYAKVGWVGALLPMAAEYRPLPVTLGVIAFYSMLLTTITAALAGKIPGSRIWWPIHKVALLGFILAWMHGVLSGSDTNTLMPLYLLTGNLLLALAMWRYLAAGINKHKRDFQRETHIEENR